MELSIIISLAFAIFSLTPNIVSSTINPTEQEAHCGGIYKGAGVINYKLGQEYNNNERCVWVFPNSYVGGRVIVILQTANFADTNDYLEVYEADSYGIFRSREHYHLRKAGDSFSILPSAVIFVVFRSDAYGQGTGFTMNYQRGTGGSFPYVGEHFHYNTPRGYLEHFPPSFSEIGHYTYTINPKLEQTQLILHYVNVSSGITGALKVYTATGNNVTFLGEYFSSSSPIVIEINSIDPIIMYVYSRFAYYQPNAGIQVYWNLDDVPDFVHKPNPIVITTSIPNNGQNFDSSYTYVMNFFSCYILYYVGMIKVP